MSVMTVETKYLHLRKPVVLGERMDGWRVSWIGGWDRGKVFFVVMLVRVKPEPLGAPGSEHGNRSWREG
jgi:hypothetical protein